MEPLSCYILNLFSHGAVESMWLRSRGLFNSIKRNTFSYYLDSVAEIQQRLFKSLFVSNPWLFYPFSSPPFSLCESFSVLTKSLCVCRVCSCLSSHLALSPSSLFTTSLWPWEEYTSSEGNKCAPAAGWEDQGWCWVNAPFPSHIVAPPPPPPFPVCLSPPSRRESKEISSSQPCLRGVWLQRKESEEVGRGAYSSDRSNWEGNTDNTEPV